MIKIKINGFYERIFMENWCRQLAQMCFESLEKTEIEFKKLSPYLCHRGKKLVKKEIKVIEDQEKTEDEGH